MVAKKNPGIAGMLLEAHVRYIVDELDGASLRSRIESEVDALLADASKLKLDEVVSRKAIKDVIRAYAVELDLHGGVPELVAEIGRRLYADGIHDRTRLVDLLSDAEFAEILDKLLEMRELRARMLGDAIDTPAYAALASDILYHGIKGYLLQGSLTQNIPGARSVMRLGKRMMQHASPGLEHSIEDNLKSYIRRNIGATLKETQNFLLGHLDESRLREFALEAWDRTKTSPVSVFRRYLDAGDLEDFFVIAYEWWRQVRKTGFYSTVIGIGVDHFFDKYGKTRLTILLDEIGVGREQLVAEAMRFAPPVIKALKKKKLLEPLIRRNLEGFYRSGAVERITGSAN